MENLTIRCSSIGYIMTESRVKSDPLSETCKTHLVDLFVADHYGRHTDTFNKYVEKGLSVEEDSITLYSRIKRLFFKKNSTRLKNDFINGEPDLYTGLEINAADCIIDIKSSWDLYTFTRAKYSPVNKQYWWQLQGYMALTGAPTSRLAYCLIDTPVQIINDEKRKLMWRMGAATDEDSNFIKACEEIDHNMTYGDIPMEERVHEIIVPRDQEAIDRIYARVRECRNYYQNTFLKIKEAV